jgi:alkylhydroperoxidase family enzyme
MFGWLLSIGVEVQPPRKICQLLPILLANIAAASVVIITSHVIESVHWIGLLRAIFYGVGDEPPQRRCPRNQAQFQERSVADELIERERKHSRCAGPFIPLSANKRSKKMQSFPIQTIQSAPDRSKPAMQNLQAAFGMMPNIAGAIATSPVLIDSLVGLFQNVHGGSFTEPQIQTILLTNAVTNASAWAVAFHTALALKEGLDQADVNAIREGGAPKDRQHAALSTLARTLIEKRGHLDDGDVDEFIDAGFGKDLLLEVIAIIAASTITNYTGSVTKPPIELPFQAYIWCK